MLVLLDLETGGTNPKKNPILQGFFLITDDNLKTVKEYEFYIKPSTIPEHLNNIEANSLKINQLDLNWMEEHGMPYNEAMNAIVNLLKEYGPNIQPVGYNVLFDIEFLKANIDGFEKLISHKYIDIYSVINFLKFCDLLPQSAGTLNSVGRLLNVSAPDNLHNAKYDVYYLKDIILTLMEEMRLKTSLVLGYNPEDIEQIVLSNLF